MAINDCEKIRKGKYITTILRDKWNIATFHEVDNLDTKTIEKAENKYEETFIRVREILQDKPWCCDNSEDVLFICQVVTDTLKDNLLIRKE